MKKVIVIRIRFAIKMKKYLFLLINILSLLSGNISILLKDLANSEINSQIINDETALDLFAEKQAMKKKLERWWHLIFKLYSYLPQVSNYLDEYNVK